MIKNKLDAYNDELVSKWIQEVEIPGSKMKEPNVATTRETRDNLSEMLMSSAFGEEAYIITHHGRQRAAMVSLSILEAVKSAKSILADFSQVNDIHAGDAKERFLDLVQTRRSSMSLTA